MGEKSCTQGQAFDFTKKITFPPNKTTCHIAGWTLGSRHEMWVTGVFYAANYVHIIGQSNYTGTITPIVYLTFS
jgi:hypothetical protein